MQRGVRVGVVAYAMWGFLTVYWKQLTAFQALELIGWRMIFAAVVMVVIVTGRRTWPAVVDALRTPRTLAMLAVAGTLLAVNWLSYVGAVVTDQVIETALGYFMAPLCTMVIGVVLLGERASRAQAIAFACAAIAVVILTISYGRPPWIAIVLAGSWSAYGLATRRIPLGPIEGLAGETFVLLAPATLLVGVLSLLGDDSVISTAGARDWVFVAGTGVVTAVPLMLFASAAKSIPFTVLGPLNLLVPVINFALGWTIYGEPMPIDRLVGFAFVWIALIVVTFERWRSPADAPAGEASPADPSRTGLGYGLRR